MKKKKETGVALLAASYYGSQFETEINRQWNTTYNYADKHGLKPCQWIDFILDRLFWEDIEKMVDLLVNDDDYITTDVLVTSDIRLPDLYRMKEYLKKKGIGLILVPNNYDPDFHKDSPKKIDFKLWLHLLWNKGRVSD